MLLITKSHVAVVSWSLEPALVNGKQITNPDGTPHFVHKGDLTTTHRSSFTGLDSATVLPADSNALAMSGTDHSFLPSLPLTDIEQEPANPLYMVSPTWWPDRSLSRGRVLKMDAFDVEMTESQLYISRGDGSPIAPRVPGSIGPNSSSVRRANNNSVWRVGKDGLVYRTDDSVEWLPVTRFYPRSTDVSFDDDGNIQFGPTPPLTSESNVGYPSYYPFESDYDENAIPYDRWSSPTVGDYSKWPALCGVQNYAELVGVSGAGSLVFRGFLFVL